MLDKKDQDINSMTNSQVVNELKEKKLAVYGTN